MKFSLVAHTGSLNDWEAEAVLTVERDTPGWQDFDPFHHNMAMKSYNINVRARTIDVKI